MTSKLTELYLRLPPQGKQAMIEGQLHIRNKMDEMPLDTLPHMAERFQLWITSNLELISALEELYPVADGNTDDQ